MYLLPSTAKAHGHGGTFYINIMRHLYLVKLNPGVSWGWR